MFKVIAIVVLLTLVACAPKKPQWQEGDIICIILTNERGMVTHARSNRYHVRMGVAETVSTGVFGPTVRQDRAYATITFREYELKDCGTTN